MNDKEMGLILALSSSILIGASFIIKKKGLKLAASEGIAAGDGGYLYLQQPMWWAGMITMIVGELANFAAYAFAPAILVTPLGALSIIVSTVLALVILKERLQPLGVLGITMCICGSVLIVIYAPEERIVTSVAEIWSMAMEPEFVTYIILCSIVVLVLIFHISPQYGQTHVLVYILICSLVGSITVMSIKALGIALKLTLTGHNQLLHKETYIFLTVTLVCVITQMNYLNKALDIFSTATVSAVYYVFFTLFTITASFIMYKDWVNQSVNQVNAQIMGFGIIMGGVLLLHYSNKQPGEDLGEDILRHMAAVVDPQLPDKRGGYNALSQLPDPGLELGSDGQEDQPVNLCRARSGDQLKQHR